MIFYISTLGCKVNQHESDILAAGLMSRGWQAAGENETAQVCIVNTCTVTQKASMQSRQVIRQLLRSHPGARIVVTGCYAQIAPAEIEAIDGVHFIAGQHCKSELADIIVQTVAQADGTALRSVAPLPYGMRFNAPKAPAPGVRTRPYLKIQDGCDSFCTYCIVPHARGRSRSMPPEQVLDHLRQLGDMGYQEVVLTGIHLGGYGKDLSPGTNLLTLMEAIEKAQPLRRIRLSSVEPNELSDPMIDLVAESDLFCPHFHLPLQSGDDRILQKMHRPYGRDLFRRQVEHIKRRLPQAGIGSDVLVGFPGEDEQAFASTLELLEALPLTYLHVFPFSARPGTPAAAFPGQLPNEVIKRRTAQVRKIGSAKKQAFQRRAVGRQTEVLVETRRDASTGLLKGVTPNYLAVLLDGGDHHMNKIVTVLVQDLHHDNRLEGCIVDPCLASDRRMPSAHTENHSNVANHEGEQNEL